MKTIWKDALVLIALLAITTLSPISITIELLALSVWALMGPQQAIQAMAISVVLKYLNPGLVSYGAESGPLFWLVLLVAMLRILPMITAIEWSLLWPIWIFGIVAASLSAISSIAPVISLLKIATFLGVVSTAIVAASKLTADQTHAITRWMLTLGFVVIALSACTLFQPAIAFKRVPNSIQGIFNHPQTLGTFIVPFAAYWASGVLLMRDSKRKIDLIMLVGVWAIMFMTLARTAAIAALAGVLAAILVRSVRGRTASEQLGLGRVIAVVLGFIVITILTALLTDIVTQAIHGFIHKREANDVGTAFYESRGLGIESEWNNFLRRPLTGWGFGIYADGGLPDGIVEFAGIPISVPVEKGFIPTAILEETGIFGGALFFFALWRLGRASFATNNLRWVAVFVACVVVNIGEAVILSPGGIGLLLWLFIALCLCNARQSISIEPQPASLLDPELPKFRNLMGANWHAPTLKSKQLP